MQTLYFEEAWDKTIAPEDRKKITTHFYTIQHQNEVVFSFLWQATNHKHETLITVLIHNPTQKPLEINQTSISYSKPDGRRITNQFDLTFPIAARTSMPWTFIFSNKNTTNQQPSFTINLPN